jgi:L-gulonolactone oxidase
MGELNRILEVERDAGLVKVEGGIGLRALNELIWGHGMAIENLGDIDRQTISGAVSTGTHGTGARFRNLSSAIEAMELILPDGTLLDISPHSEPELLPSVRIGLGALGVIATLTLRTVPAFSVRRTDSPLALAETLERLQDLADGSDHFEFYVFPHTEVALLRQSERTDEPPQPRNSALEFGQEVILENWVMGAIARAGRRLPSRIPRLSRFVSSQLAKSTKVDRSYRVFASRRLIRFTEMEYAIPRRHAAEAIPRVIEAAERADPPVGFPVEVRFVAADDSILSPAHDRDTCYIAVHQYQGMAWEGYFRSVEAIMDEYGGRPHWGKRHFQTAATLAERYPRWEDFLSARARFDPEGTFRNQYLDRVLGPPTRSALQAVPS